MSEVQKYSTTAMALHWIMALLIFTLFAIGWFMVDLPKGTEERTFFFKLHKNIGITVFLLLLVRIAWAIFDKRPSLPSSLSPWQRKLAASVHHSLYLFMIIQPVTGFISSCFTKYKTSYWGYFDFPRIFEPDAEWNSFFSEVHHLSSYLLGAAIVLHLLGAFAFLYSNHENVLKRMLPGGR